MKAHFQRFTIDLTKDQAASASHPGDCDADVKALLRDPRVRRQLERIVKSMGNDAIRDELKRWGAWTDAELRDIADNFQRIVWLAACDITENLAQKERA